MSLATRLPFTELEQLHPGILATYMQALEDIADERKG